jgi:hypothetical protein
VSPHYSPDDLKGLDAAVTCKLLFGEDPEDNPWWSLEREDESSFRWTDKYLGVSWSATHGYLIALQEVSTVDQAFDFARKNRIHLFKEGGLSLKGKGVAELFIRTQGIPPRELAKTDSDLYRLRFRSGTLAKIGYGSMLFLRLVSGPAAEGNPNFPDPKTLTTLVLCGVEGDEVESVADLALFHFRRHFKGINFSFWAIKDLHLAPGFEESPEAPDPPNLVEGLENAHRPEAIAFFNRAKENGTITGFLYFYRVLESCFDYVINQEVQQWRSDTTLDCGNLIRKIKRLHSEREDKWSLRRVLGAILDQPLLEKAVSSGLIRSADAESLSEAIYTRRNSIAHGRGKMNEALLVPYGFPLGDTGQHDRSWYNLMEDLASRSLGKWIFF